MAILIRDKLLLSVFVIGCFTLAECEANRARKGKFFNIFQVISFQNGPCEGSGNRNGTCYTEQECDAKGGANGGTCAAGFGVCCIITINCGETSNENCTYFDSNGVMDGCCTATICPCNDNICQLRLDFDTFTLTGPSTDINSVTFRRANGGDITVNVAEAADSMKVPLTEFTQCLTDTFSVSNPDGPNPPTICGINSGEHMYVESSDCCNKLQFALGSNGIGAPMATRSWSIKVTQYSCNYPNLAPQGCTQYFFDGNIGSVQSYNYNNGNGIHLASQDQAICVRRERNNCRICWTTVETIDFAVTGGGKGRDPDDPDAIISLAQRSIRNPNRCCDYGASKTSTSFGFDCVSIPFNLVDGDTPVARNQFFCGNMGLKGGSNCSTRTPFQVNFRSDHFEPVKEVATFGAANGPANNRGFRLVYVMDSTACAAASIVNPAP